MSQINISNLTFFLQRKYDTIFKHVSFCIDTQLEIGFIGRNGKGEETHFFTAYGENMTTAVNISSNVTFEQFSL